MAILMASTAAIFTGSAAAGDRGPFVAPRIDVKGGTDGSMQDPRSGAALNREALLRHRGTSARTPPTLHQISNGTVNNPTTDTTHQDTQSAATLLNLGGGKLVAAFLDSGSYDGVFGGGNDHLTGFAYSSNNGLTWTDGGVLPDSPEGDGGAPILAFDPVSGAVYLASPGLNSATSIRVFKSTDDGHTFLPAVDGTPGYTGTSEQQDRPWIAVDPFAGPGQGNVYICWTNFFSSGSEIRFTRSTDGGATFGPVFPSSPVITRGGQGCSIAVSPNHQVNLFYYRGSSGGFLNGGDNKLFTRRSLDGGVTWQPEVQIADLATASVNGNLALKGGWRTNSFPQAAINPVVARPFIFVVYNDDPAPANANDNGDIYYVRSTDGGLTWSARVRVNDDTLRDQFLPGIAFTTDGEDLLFSYYSRTHDPNNLLFHRQARLGTLLGSGVVSFPSGSFQIGPNTVPVIGQDPILNLTVLSDLEQVAGLSPNQIGATWTDTRKGNSFHAFQPDVRFARITAPPVAADISVNISALPTTIELGDDVVLTVTASAAGGTAEDVFANVVLPTGLSFRSVSMPGACSEAQGFIGCSLGSVAGGASKSFTVTARAIYTAATRRVNATATTSGDDPVAANNSDFVDIPVTAAATTTTVFSTGNIAAPIPPNTEFSIPVTGPGVGTQISVRLRMNHTWDSDLAISLISPSGKIINVTSGNGGSSDNYGSGANDCTGTKTVFNDLASIPITSGVPPFAGSFKPEQPFASVLGGNMFGAWKLRVLDTVSGDSGTVGCIDLVITRATP